MSGAICGGPTLTDAVNALAEGLLAGADGVARWYRFGARCHLDGRFLSEVTALMGWATMGTFRLDENDPNSEELPYITGPTIATVVGACKRHGWVEAEYDHIEWGDYDG